MTNGMRVMVRRASTAVGLGLLAALVVAGAASAKGTPYFTVEMNPPEPVADEAVIVAVRTWEDVAHTIPAGRDPTTATLDRLLVFRFAAGGSPDVPIRLEHRGQGEFQARVVMPTAGEWKLVAFPDRTGWASPDVPPGYPDTIVFTVKAPSDGVMSFGPLAALAAVIGIIVMIVGLVRLAKRLSVLRHPNPTRHP